MHASRVKSRGRRAASQGGVHAGELGSVGRELRLLALGPFPVPAGATGRTLILRASPAAFHAASLASAPLGGSLG